MNVKHECVNTETDGREGSELARTRQRNKNATTELRKSKVVHRCLSSASPRDAAMLRGVLRVLREWVLARSAPASPFARVCALHLLCRDAGFCMMPG